MYDSNFGNLRNIVTQLKNGSTQESLNLVMLINVVRKKHVHLWLHRHC